MLKEISLKTKILQKAIQKQEEYFQNQNEMMSQIALLEQEEEDTQKAILEAKSSISQLEEKCISKKVESDNLKQQLAPIIEESKNRKESILNNFDKRLRNLNKEENLKIAKVKQTINIGIKTFFNKEETNLKKEVLTYKKEFQKLKREKEKIAKERLSVRKSLENIKKDYVDEVDQAEMIDSAINGVLQSLDPYSAYMSPDLFKSMQTESKGEFGGLGIEVTMEDGFVKVVSPIDDTPADKANIQPGDLIIGIDDEGVYGLTLDEAVEKLRGEIGEPVVITIRRGNIDPFEVKIIRDEIKISSVKSEIFDNIGYIRLTTFSQQTTPGLVKEVQNFKKELGDKFQGIVLDLRNNPGGLLSEAISVSDSFLELGEIVSTRGRDGKDSTHHYSRPGDIISGLPLVVLINSGSASASEIVAGALKDHKRAVILGTRSFGKGSVQTVIPLPGHGAMRLTTARYYTPSGISIQAKGISPDIEVEVAKIEPIDFGIVREEDIRGALDKKQEDDKANKIADNEDNISETLSNDNETSLGDSLDVSEKRQDEIDFQLSRALDLIRGASVFNSLKK